MTLKLIFNIESNWEMSMAGIVVTLACYTWGGSVTPELTRYKSVLLPLNKAVNPLFLEPPLKIRFFS
jgi:hypothetical protein